MARTTTRKVPKNSGLAHGQRPGSVPLIDPKDLPAETRAGLLAWLEDRFVRTVRDSGYCSESTNVMSRITPPLYGGSYVDTDGVDCFNNKWRDEDGYDVGGFDANGRDKDGFDANGFDRDGFNRDGVDPAGIGRDDPARFRYDRSGRDRDGFDRLGRDRNGKTREQTVFNRILVFDSNGRDPDGYNTYGENSTNGEYSPNHDRGRPTFDAEPHIRRWVAEGKLPASILPAETTETPTPA